MVIVGITGGIGSGKSYVSELLKQRGVPVFDCDSQAKRLTLEDSIIRESLIALLGPGVYVDGKLNKPVLASFLFASKENAAKVNAIIHPQVRKSFREWVACNALHGNDVVAMESAILFESGFNSEVDYVLMVHAPLDIRCSRVMERDHATLEDVERRIKSQMSDEEKSSMSDFVIENDGQRSLDGQLDALISSLKDIKASK